MTRADALRDCLRKIWSMASDEQLAEWLLHYSKNCAGDPNEFYELWCDNQGACKGRDCEEFGDCCSDEEHTACILRFLQAEYTQCL